MRGLTKEVAMEIVRRTMHVIGYNVNVMDKRGRIIGSGDGKRLGQSHEGALLAIERRGRFEIDQESAARLQGYCPARTLLLSLRMRLLVLLGLLVIPRK